MSPQTPHTHTLTNHQPPLCSISPVVTSVSTSSISITSEAWTSVWPSPRTTSWYSTARKMKLSAPPWFRTWSYRAEMASFDSSTIRASFVACTACMTTIWWRWSGCCADMEWHPRYGRHRRRPWRIFFALHSLHCIACCLHSNVWYAFFAATATHSSLFKYARRLLQINHKCKPIVRLIKNHACIRISESNCPALLSAIGRSHTVERWLAMVAQMSWYQLSWHCIATSSSELWIGRRYKLAYNAVLWPSKCCHMLCRIARHDADSEFNAVNR